MYAADWTLWECVWQGKMAVGKDAEMSPFEAARRLLSSESERMSMGDRVDCVFQDMDLVPLLVQVLPPACLLFGQVQALRRAMSWH